MFPYSEREGTDAQRLPDAVPPATKAARSREIRERIKHQAAEYRRNRIGTRAHVVLEGDDLATAVTGDYLKMPACDSLKNGGPQLQPAWIVSDGNGGLRATAAKLLG